MGFRAGIVRDAQWDKSGRGSLEKNCGGVVIPLSL